jgi:hypothetical protein
MCFNVLRYNNGFYSNRVERCEKRISELRSPLMTRGL